MFTIQMIRTGTCDDCHVQANGVEFARERDPGQTAFLCWRHFRMKLEAKRVARQHAEEARGAPLGTVAEAAEAVRPVPEQALRTDPTQAARAAFDHVDNARQYYLHGETKGGTDRRDTGGEG